MELRGLSVEVSCGLCRSASLAADDDDHTSDEDDTTAAPVQRLQDEGGNAMKKPITVDGIGTPHGNLLKNLRDDVKLFAADLDITTSWDQQQSSDRRRFFERLYTGLVSTLHFFSLL